MKMFLITILMISFSAHARKIVVGGKEAHQVAVSLLGTGAHSFPVADYYAVEGREITCSAPTICQLVIADENGFFSLNRPSANDSGLFFKALSHVGVAPRCTQASCTLDVSQVYCEIRDVRSGNTNYKCVLTF